MPLSVQLMEYISARNKRLDKSPYIGDHRVSAIRVTSIARMLVALDSCYELAHSNDFEGLSK